MNPRVIIHNSVSLDGSFVGIDVDMGLHYQIAAAFKPDAHLIGSVTAKTGLETFGEQAPEEDASDFKKPNREGSPYWVLVDSEGILEGRLHGLRRFEWCRDVILLVSKATTEDYLAYLRERDYDYFVSGENHIDFKESFAWLSKRYGVNTILTDTGGALGSALLNAGLVDEISLLVHPVVVGKKADNLFKLVDDGIDLTLAHHEVVGEKILWVTYRCEHP